MVKFPKQEKIRRIFNQVIAIAEKDIRLKNRYKTILIKDLITPIVSTIFPFIVMNFVLSTTPSLGYWNSSNYVLFILLGYLIYLVRGIITDIPNDFIVEKYWKTLEALMIAPMHRFILIVGKFLSNMIFILIPFVGILVVGYIFFPCSALTIFAIIVIMILISIAFIGIGGFLGIFAITRETYWRFLDLGLYFVFFLSAVNYPIEIFPEFFQFFIRLNPLYYWFDTLRITWIENDILFTIGAHPLHFVILVSSSIIFPLITIYLFDYIFKKWGIEGY